MPWWGWLLVTGGVLLVGWWVTVLVVSFRTYRKAQRAVEEAWSVWPTRRDDEGLGHRWH